MHINIGLLNGGMLGQRLRHGVATCEALPLLRNRTGTIFHFFSPPFRNFLGGKVLGCLEQLRLNVILERDALGVCSQERKIRPSNAKFHYFSGIYTFKKFLEFHKTSDSEIPEKKKVLSELRDFSPVLVNRPQGRNEEKDRLTSQNFVPARNAARQGKISERPCDKGVMQRPGQCTLKRWQEIQERILKGYLERKRTI